MNRSMSKHSRLNVKHLAILGILLPYIVDLSLIFAFRSKIGHSTYSNSPKEWNFYGDVIVYSFWIAVLLSAVLPLPYLVEFIKKRTTMSPDRALSIFKNGGIALAYVAIIIVNWAVAFLAHMVGWVLAGGVI
jgi:hypothetical protein